MSRPFIPSPGYKLFLVRLVQARTDRGLSQEELADRLGLPTPLIIAYENGERPLDFVQTRTWCLALDVPFTEFVLQVGDDIESNLHFDEPIIGHEPKDIDDRDDDGVEQGSEPDDPYGVAHIVLPLLEGDDVEGTAPAPQEPKEEGDDLFDDFDALEKH